MHLEKQEKYHINRKLKIYKLKYWKKYIYENISFIYGNNQLKVYKSISNSDFKFSYIFRKIN